MSATNGNGNGHLTTHFDDLDSLARVSGVGFGGSGMSNHVTGMGTAKDPTSYFQVSLNRPKLSQVQQDAYVEQFGLCRKIVSTIPTASTHKWGRVTLSEGNQDQINAITDYLNAVQIQQPYGNDLLGTQNGFQEALAIAFQSGNAAWLLDIDDGGSPEDELDESRIKSIRSITLVDRWFVRPEMLPTIVRIGNNEANGIRGFTHYTLTGMSFGTTTRVHKSRVLWFRGAELKGNSLYRQSGCDDSMLEGLTYCLNMMFNVIGGLGRMSVDYEVTLHKIQGLLQGIEDGGAKAVEKYRERLNINSTRRSLYNDYIVDKELEDIVHVTRQVSGYGEIYDRILKFVQQSSPYPPAVLMGDFASGLDASGKETSERSLWNDTIAQVQMQKLHGNLMRWLNLVCLAKDGPTKGKVPKGLGWQWIPLYQMTPSEQAELELTQSQVITAVSSISPQVALNMLLAHYSKSEYDPNTTLLPKVIEALEKKIEQGDQQPDQGQAGAEGSTPDQGADQGGDDDFNFEEFQQPGDEAAPEDGQTDSLDHEDDRYSHINFVPPVNVRKAFKQGLALHEAGKTGKGLEAATVREARAIVRGEAISPQKVDKGYRFFIRNARFASMPKGSDAFGSWWLWGATAGRAWFNDLKRQMDAADARSDSDTLKGKTVSWKYGEGTAEGTIVRTYNRPTSLKLQGSEIKRNGTDDNPALLIEQENGSRVLKLQSEVRFDGRSDSAEVRYDEDYDEWRFDARAKSTAKVGDTKQVGDKTYILNANKRWARHNPEGQAAPKKGRGKKVVAELSQESEAKVEAVVERAKKAGTAKKRDPKDDPNLTPESRAKVEVPKADPETKSKAKSAEKVKTKEKPQKEAVAKTPVNPDQDKKQEKTDSPEFQVVTDKKQVAKALEQWDEAYNAGKAYVDITNKIDTRKKSIKEQRKQITESESDSVAVPAHVLSKEYIEQQRNKIIGSTKVNFEPGTFQDFDGKKNGYIVKTGDFEGKIADLGEHGFRANGKRYKTLEEAKEALIQKHVNGEILKQKFSKKEALSLLDASEKSLDNQLSEAKVALKQVGLHEVDPQRLGNSISIISEIKSAAASGKKTSVLLDKNGNLQSAFVHTKRKDDVYVDYMATAPWNLTKDHPNKTKGAGVAALKTAIQESETQGRKGKLSLNPLDNSEDFYLEAGFRPVEKSKDGEWSLDPVAAQRLKQGIKSERQDGTHFSVPNYVTGGDMTKAAKAVSEKMNISDNRAREVIDAVNDFTRNGYDEIRSNERKGIKDSRVDAINEYLEKMPKFNSNAQMYRGLDFDTKQDLDGYLKSLSTGYMELNAMSSFSTSRSISEDMYASGDHAVLFVTKGNKTGVSVRSLSNVKDEDEVVLPRGSQFKILSKKKVKGRTVIEIEPV